MPMYNLIEYSENYQDSSATLYQYKRDEPPDNNVDLTANNSTSFKYKVNLFGNPVITNRIVKKKLKIVVTLKYLSNFFESLEMPLINSKIKLNLTWKKELMLYLLLMIQNYKFQLLLCQKKIIKILLNKKIKVFNDLFIGMNIKQNKKMKMQMVIMPILLGILI